MGRPTTEDGHAPLVLSVAGIVTMVAGAPRLQRPATVGNMAAGLSARGKAQR